MWLHWTSQACATGGGSVGKCRGSNINASAIASGSWPGQHSKSSAVITGRACRALQLVGRGGWGGGRGGGASVTIMVHLKVCCLTMTGVHSCGAGLCKRTDMPRMHRQHALQSPRC